MKSILAQVNGDIYKISGDANAEIRQTIIEGLTGEKVSKSKAGINKVKEVVEKHIGITPDSEAGKRDQIKKWAKGEKPAELPKQEGVESVGEKVTPTEEVKKVEEVKVEAPKEEVRVEAEVPKQKEGEIDHKEIRKDIQEQVNTKDKETRDAQQKSIDEAKADKEKVLNNDKETIDKYVKKSGYKLITEETKHPLGGDRTFRDKIGQYYKQTSGLSVTIKSGKQVALDAIEVKSKLKPSGLKVNAYENSQRAAIDFEKGKISIDEFKEILKKDGLNVPKSLEVKAEAELPKPKEQPWKLS